MTPIDDVTLVYASGPVGLPSIQKKSIPKKKKSICPNGTLFSDTAKSISNETIKRRNKVILSTLQNSSSVIEAAKSWEVGALLSLFDVGSKADIENILLKNISRLQKDANAT